MHIKDEKVNKIKPNRDFADIIKAILKEYRIVQMKHLRIWLAIAIMFFVPVIMKKSICIGKIS